MLLSPADDGLAAGGALLFPAWPCAWDADFKLRAPRASGQIEGPRAVRWAEGWRQQAWELQGRVAEDGGHARDGEQHVGAACAIM